MSTFSGGFLVVSSPQELPSPVATLLRGIALGVIGFEEHANCSGMLGQPAMPGVDSALALMHLVNLKRTVIDSDMLRSRMMEAHVVLSGELQSWSVVLLIRLRDTLRCVLNELKIPEDTRAPFRILLRGQCVYPHLCGSDSPPSPRDVRWRSVPKLSAGTVRGLVSLKEFFAHVLEDVPDQVTPTPSGTTGGNRNTPAQLKRQNRRRLQEGIVALHKPRTSTGVTAELANADAELLRLAKSFGHTRIDGKFVHSCRSALNKAKRKNGGGETTP